MVLHMVEAVVLWWKSYGQVISRAVNSPAETAGLAHMHNTKIAGSDFQMPLILKPRATAHRDPFSYANLIYLYFEEMYPGLSEKKWKM